MLSVACEPPLSITCSQNGPLVTRSRLDSELQTPVAESIFTVAISLEFLSQKVVSGRLSPLGGSVRNHRRTMVAVEGISAHRMRFRCRDRPPGINLQPGQKKAGNLRPLGWPASYTEWATNVCRPRSKCALRDCRHKAGSDHDTDSDIDWSDVPIEFQEQSARRRRKMIN
jgi:hypothetical protein